MNISTIPSNYTSTDNYTSNTTYIFPRENNIPLAVLIYFSSMFMIATFIRYVRRSPALTDREFQILRTQMARPPIILPLNPGGMAVMIVIPST